MTTISLIIAIVLCQPNAEVSHDARAGMVLGARAAKVQSKLPVLNQVVLVPDEATYLDEISRWSPTARWPVLFDREPFASQFIRRFNPEKVWKRDPVTGGIDDIEATMQRVVAKSWGGDSSIESALATLQLPPLGVVFTSSKDTARTGAVALAAGRGQLLKFLPGKWGGSGDILGESKTTSLISAIDEILASTGVRYKEIGDTIDALTICRTMPSRVNFAAAKENPVAVSDVIGRDQTGKRFAWTGWVFGSKAQSTYLAMCSLFLPRSEYWFCNTYPNSGSWATYGFGNFKEALPRFGVNAQSIGGSVGQLQQADKGGVKTDVIMFTSKGNQDFLEMADNRTAPSWLPILNTPTVLYFLHSWSLKDPQNKSTVGGTWMSRGVYAYVGSSHEPMLTAFVPPLEILKRTMSNIPFLPASRWFSGEGIYARAWRLNTIGDPLMLCGAKGSVTRILKPAEASADYIDAHVIAKEAMQYAVDHPSDIHFSKAIDSVTSLGMDSLAIGMWGIAVDQSSTGDKSARSILPALFREQDEALFINAYKLLPAPSRIEKDMLWHLVGTSKNTSLSLLIDNIRNPYSFDDLAIIAERVASTRGTAAVLSIIDEKLKRAKGRIKKELERMRKEFGG
jgi:hypothetical protein